MILLVGELYTWEVPYLLSDNIKLCQRTIHHSSGAVVTMNMNLRIVYRIVVIYIKGKFSAMEKDFCVSNVQKINDIAIFRILFLLQALLTIRRLSVNLLHIHHKNLNETIDILSIT